jgi:hypothetical protein
MAMKDAQDQENYRRMFRGSEYLKTGHTIMEEIASMSKGVSNQVYWRVGMVMDLVAKIAKNAGGRSTFLSKREC